MLTVCERTYNKSIMIAQQVGLGRANYARPLTER
jgi:hypothetical protein